MCLAWSLFIVLFFTIALGFLCSVLKNHFLEFIWIGKLLSFMASIFAFINNKYHFYEDEHTMCHNILLLYN